MNLDPKKHLLSSFFIVKHSIYVNYTNATLDMIEHSSR